MRTHSVKMILPNNFGVSELHCEGFNTGHDRETRSSVTDLCDWKKAPERLFPSVSDLQIGVYFHKLLCHRQHLPLAFVRELLMRFL
jgi:hypothetical protein